MFDDRALLRGNARTVCARMNSPSAVARHLLDAAGAAAVVAASRPDARLDAVAPALSAANCDLNGHFARDAGCRVLEVDLDLRRDVGSTRAPRPGRHAEDVVAEEGREDVGEASEVEGGGPEPAAAEPGVTEAVVQLAGLGLREHLVRLDDLLEALVRVRGVGNVRVQLAREPPERALDVGFGGRAPDAEHLVVVATRDRPSVLFVHRFDEARELVRSRPDRADRLLVVHAERPDQADRSERARSRARTTRRRARRRAAPGSRARRRRGRTAFASRASRRAARGSRPASRAPRGAAGRLRARPLSPRRAGLRHRPHRAVARPRPSAR